MKKIVVLICVAIALCLSTHLSAQGPWQTKTTDLKEFIDRGIKEGSIRTVTGEDIKREMRESKQKGRIFQACVFGVLAIVSLFTFYDMFRKRQLIMENISVVWNNPSARPFAICTIAGVLLCIFGLVQVDADPTFAEFGRALGGADDAELYFRRAISNPVLIIGLVALVVGIFGIFVNSGNKEE